MPLCDDPNATGWYTLRGDREKPAATRPMFECRFVTKGGKLKVRRMIDNAVETKDDAVYGKILADSIRSGVVGWRNIRDKDGNEIPFSLEALNDIISDDEDKGRLRDDEIAELAYNWPLAVSFTEDDRKNFGLPPTSGAASSATPAVRQVAA